MSPEFSTARSDPRPHAQAFTLYQQGGCGELCMRCVSKLLTGLALACLLTGPALALPPLSAHLPTVSPLSSPPPVPVDRTGIGLLGFALAGAIQVKDTATVAGKWSTRANNAGQDYATGVQGAGGKWIANATAAEPHYIA